MIRISYLATAIALATTVQLAQAAPASSVEARLQALEQRLVEAEQRAQTAEAKATAAPAATTAPLKCDKCGATYDAASGHTCPL